MCRNCGAIVGAGETVCPQCGVPLAGAAANVEMRRPVYDREAMRFARAVLTRPYNFTILFLVANLFVFLLMWSSSGMQGSALWAFPHSVLDGYGAKRNYLINASGEWWRFVTPVFIHVNLPHILVNMWSLWVVGPYVEKLYGSAKFVFFWVLTGVCGVVASYLTVQPQMHVNSVGRFLFKTMDDPSAGASGALFGMVGVLFVFGIKFRRELPEGFKRAFGTGLLPMIMMNLFIGYLGRGFIDNAAHLGGFFSGALVALFVSYKRPGERASVAVIWHVLQLAALALVVVSFLMVALHFPKGFPLDKESNAASTEREAQTKQEAETDISAYLNATNEGEAVFINAFNSGDLKGVDKAVEQLKDVSSPDEAANSLRMELVSLLERLRKLQAAEGKPGNAASTAEREKLKDDFKAWENNHIRWAKENQKKYGLKIDEGQENNETPPQQNGSNNNRTTKD
ncbi:MAG TPA: rhomboid family intramembrane serine protease [Pyrinomonadaceae bacterium]|jgi:rhomboid protease GluP